MSTENEIQTSLPESVEQTQNAQAFPPQNFTQTETPEETPQTNDSFIQRIGTKTSEIIDYIKTKTSNIQNMNPLVKSDFDVNLLTEIKIEDFDKERDKNLVEVKSNKLEKGKFNDTKLTVVIRNPVLKNDSYFKISYMMYEVFTEEFNLSVNRRYSDFLWLRECLKSMFPSEIIPLLPKKKMGNRRFEDDFIKKRTVGLQKFLDEILSKEYFKATECLIDFLSLQDRAEFEKKMNTVNYKTLNAANIEGLNSLEGNVKTMNFENENIELNPKDYYTNISNYMKTLTFNLDKINKNLHYFKKNMTSAYNNLDEIEKCFSNLLNINQKVDLKSYFDDIITQYQILFKNWKRVLINQTCVVKDSVHKGIKDIYNLSDNFVEILYKEDGMRQDYLTKKNKLVLKKENLWPMKDIEKWETNQKEDIDMIKIYEDKDYAFEKMCYKETEVINNLRGYISYYFYNNQDTFKQYLTVIQKLFNDHLRDFVKKFQDTLSDSFEIYSNLTMALNLE